MAAAHAASASAASKIQAFLGASRIAVVGASKDRAKFGNKVRVRLLLYFNFIDGFWGWVGRPFVE